MIRDSFAQNTGTIEKKIPKNGKSQTLDNRYPNCNPVRAFILWSVSTLSERSQYQVSMVCRCWLAVSFKAQ